MKHEELSGFIFKRILIKHKKVLVMFVRCSLTFEDIGIIENMINCSEKVMVSVFVLMYIKQNM